MSLPDRWKRGLRPDPEVIRLLGDLREAAERGEIRAMAVVTVDPTLRVEGSSAGDHEDTGVRKRLLAAGLIQVSNTLLSK